MNLRSKSETTQTNEILCKCLCHNLCILIQETFELGISTDFEHDYAQINYCAERNPAQKIKKRANFCAKPPI